MRVKDGRFDAIPRYVDAAQGAAKRATALTQRLLAFSRRQTLDPRPVNANPLIGEMDELIRRTMGPSVTVEVVGAGGLWMTLADPNQLENTLLNLAINARDAMPDGGRLTLETSNKWLDERGARKHDLPPGQYVCISVSDTGTGMTPDVIARAFDPFFTTKPLGQGTGLGLSMIHGFVRQSGGQVRIYSEPDKGTTISLYLPRHVGGDGEVEEEAGESRSNPDYDGHGETVLVVDDEHTVRMLIVDVLHEAGYRTMEASDGPKALKVLQSGAPIDLLITDVGLPGGMNGRQVADAGRALRPQLKVLFITGYAENAVVGNGILEQGMQIITKPFAIDALGDKIRKMLDTS
jgi:CheY-like chemotaxis protein